MIKTHVITDYAKVSETVASQELKNKIGQFLKRYNLTIDDFKIVLRNEAERTAQTL